MRPDGGRNSRAPRLPRKRARDDRHRRGLAKGEHGPRARAEHARPRRGAGERVRPRGRRRHRALPVRSRPHRRLAELDGWPPAGAWPGDRDAQLRGVHAADVSELCPGAGERPRAGGAGAGRGDRGGTPDPARGTAAALTGRIRVSRLRPPGRAARPGPLHPCPGRSPGRWRLPVPRMALQAFPLRPAVHARKLRDRRARGRCSAVDVQGHRRRLEPRRRGADRAGGEGSRPFAAVGRRLRRTEPGAARAGGRGGPQ